MDMKARLAEKPDDPVLQHALARAAYDLGRYDIAVAYAGRAVRTDPRGAFHVTLGLALRRLGHKEAARSALHVSVLTDPDNPSTHLAFSESLEEDGEVVDAEAELRLAVDMRPLEAGYHLVLARFLERHGRVCEALSVARRATRLAASDDVMTRQYEASLLARMGDVQEAEPLFARIRALCPHDPAAWANHGAILFELGQLDEAREVLEQAVTMAAPAAETLSNLGLVRMALGDLAGADRLFSAAQSLRTDDTRIMLNRGTCLSDLGQWDEAERLFRDVMTGNPESTDAVRARFNLGTIQLAEGRFSEGWRNFEARRTLVQPLPRPDLPAWDGRETSHPVLLCGEQGLGDYLQFLRYVPQAAHRAPIDLLVPETLFYLLQESLELPFWREACDADRLRMYSSAQDCRAKAKASLLSLPSLLGGAKLSSSGPYLHRTAEPTLQKRDSLRVGLCWEGNPGYRFDRRRSIGLERLEPLLSVPGVEWFSLVPSKIPDGFKALPEGDLSVTAAVMNDLDLVISVDTAMAHLAGALGVPLWLFNRFGGDWRWASGNWDTKTGKHLWYPQTRMFAQQTADMPEQAWREPIAEAARALWQKANQPRP
ncbi:tetratricopeptide repeat protein [Acetobacter sp.]|uniref:tetratricopeptide repeat protein n=1 Tax=Acetobacter sp. TaxID=440 RepID=UPI0039E95C3F